MSKDEFANYVLEQLEPLGNVSLRQMFGGYAIFLNNLAIAFIADGDAYFKVDESNRADYEAMGSEPLVYNAKGKAITLSNWRLPIEILEDSEKLIEWAEKSYQVAKNAKKK